MQFRQLDSYILIDHNVFRFGLESLPRERGKNILTQGEIRLTIVTKKGEKKLLGNIEFDLAKFINSGKESTIVVKEFGDKVKMVFE